MSLAMTRRAALFTQADIARAIRAARQSGADSVEIRSDGTIVVTLKGVPLQPDDPEDEFMKWKHEQEKTSRDR